MPSHQFSVTVKPQFLADQSDPEAGRFMFAYTITVTNTGTVTAKLMSRHWIITDADRHVEEVRGPGVVGEQPVLRPGESFQYTSGCPLPTPVGSMKGTYQCVGDDGLQFEVEIPEFVLSMPRTLH